MLQNYLIDVTKLLQRRYKTMKSACSSIPPSYDYRLLTIDPRLKFFAKLQHLESALTVSDCLSQF